MTYDPNIPQASDLISVSQSQLQTNFSQANSIFNAEHVAFNNATVANRGKHRAIKMLEQSSTPTTAAGEGAFYTQDSSGTTNLFFRRDSNGSIIQMTNGLAPVDAETGRTMLPGNLMIQWGVVSGTAPSVSVTFNTPFAATAYSVVATSRVNVPAGGFRVVNVTASGFDFVKSSGTISAYYIAIGKAS